MPEGKAFLLPRRAQPSPQCRLLGPVALVGNLPGDGLGLLPPPSPMVIFSGQTVLAGRSLSDLTTVMVWVAESAVNIALGEVPPMLIGFLMLLRDGRLLRRTIVGLDCIRRRGCGSEQHVFDIGQACWEKPLRLWWLSRWHFF